MRGRGIGAGLVFLVWIVPFPTTAQILMWNDSVEVFNLAHVTYPGQSLVRLRIRQQVEYSLTFSGGLFINWEHDPNANQFLILQDLIYHCQISNDRRFRFIQKIDHHLGVQYFFDSISRFHVDNNAFETRLEWRLHKNHGVFISSILSTRILNGYSFSLNDSGTLVRIPNSSFMTPFTGIFSGGFQFKWPLFGSLNFGITSARLTWIRDKGIYTALDVPVYYGVPAGQPNLFEYGLSLQLLIAHEVSKWLYWNCDVLIFKNTDLLADVSIKNLFSFPITRFLKAKIHSRIFYEERISKKVQLENIVSVGLVVGL